MCGGAREDGDAEKCAGGLLACGSARLPEAFSRKTAAERGCGLAHCDVVSAREQLRLQQQALRTVTPFDSAREEPWHWCVLRMQQACAGAGVAATASGRKFPASVNNSRNLAVKRCMVSDESGPQGGESIEHIRRRAQADI